MSEKPVPPKTQAVYLHPKHPFARLTDREFENLFGPHAERRIVQPLPIDDEVSIWLTQ